MKVCSKCQKRKRASCYGKRSSSKDGLFAMCKDCRSKDAKKYYDNNIDKESARKKKYRLDNPKKVREDYKRYYENNIEKESKRKAKFYKENKQLVKDRIYKYRSDHPDRHYARGVLTNMLRYGKIKKPVRCSLCKSVRFVEGHHPDYSKPKEVVWLCKSCHRQEHTRRKK